MKFSVAVLCLFAVAHGQHTGAVLKKPSENTFAAMPNLPSCATAAVLSGDPSKGASVLLAKSTAGCVIPWHWHTPTEHVMMVSGSAKLEMKDGAPTVLGAGGYAMLPGKHVHQFSCPSACSFFVSSDGAFDIHYVDANGQEIPAEKALGTSKTTAKK
jgi:quercetin dioxygenase-like cupin family protein